MREIYEVDLEKPDLFEVSALLISTLAIPAAVDHKQRDQLYLSLCSWFIRDRGARDPAWAQRPQMVRPDYACRPEALIKRDVGTLDRRLKDRVTAGHMAIAFLKEAETGATPKLPAGVTDLTVNKMSDYALEERGIADAENFKTRLWRPSLSVLHLCAAWATSVQEVFNETGKRVLLNEVMQRPEFLKQLLERAEIYEALLERSRLKIKPESLIRFRLAGPGVI